MKSPMEAMQLSPNQTGGNGSKENNSEKQKAWNEIAARVERICDKLGRPVDPGIKETVIAFQALKLPTDSSCEGHLDHGLPYPWIDVPTGNAHFKKEFEELNRVTKEKGYTNAETVRQKDLALYNRAVSLTEESNSHKAQLKQKIASLLDEFYKTHKPSSESYRYVIREAPASCRIEPFSGTGVGVESSEKFKIRMESMLKEHRDSFLVETQKEMKAITEFLKKKFFSESV